MDQWLQVYGMGGGLITKIERENFRVKELFLYYCGGRNMSLTFVKALKTEH